MSQQVASLYAKIGADTKGFEDGAKKVKTQLTSLAPGIEKATKGVGNFVSANAGLIGVLGGVGAGIGIAIKDTMKYASSVRDLSLATGSTAEESSRLLQVLDDYEITAADVTAGMRAMKEKGIVPTIDSLADLSEQFLAIEDPAKALQFAQDNLGRSSAKFLNVLSQGPDKIRQLNGAVSDSLILTDEQIRKSEEARLAMDAWGDAVMGAKVEIATGMLPVLDAFDNSEKELAESLGLSGREADRFAASILSMKNNTDSATQSYTAWARSIETSTEALSEQGEVIDSVDYSSLVSTMQSIQSETDNYRATQTQLREEMALLKEEYFAGNVAQDEYKAKVGEITGAMRENELAHIQAGKSIAFSLVQQKMAIDGLSTAEFKALTSMGVAWGIFDQATADSAVAMDEAAGNIALAAGEVNDSLKDPVGKMVALNEKIEAAAKKSGMSWEYTFNIITHGRVPNLPVGPTVQIEGGGQQACFIAGTKISMADGTNKPIETIEVGDEVITFDLEQNRPVAAIVTETYHHSEEQAPYYLKVNDALGVTPNHPMMTPEGWKEAGQLELGDLLIKIDGNAVVVWMIERIGESVPTYNLHVDHPSHNYYANEFLAHNKARGGKASGPGDGMRDTFLVPLANGEFVVQSSIVKKPGVLQFLEALNSGMLIRGFAGGGLSHGDGPLTGDDLRQAKIDQRKRRGDTGGGVTVSTTEPERAEESAVSSGIAAMGLTGGPMGQAVAASAAIQAASSVQSVKQLTSINQKLETLIAITPSAQGIARAAGNMGSKYS